MDDNEIPCLFTKYKGKEIKLYHKDIIWEQINRVDMYYGEYVIYYKVKIKGKELKGHSQFSKKYHGSNGYRFHHTTHFDGETAVGEDFNWLLFKNLDEGFIIP